MIWLLCALALADPAPAAGGEASPSAQVALCEPGVDGCTVTLDEQLTSGFQGLPEPPPSPSAGEMEDLWRLYHLGVDLAWAMTWWVNTGERMMATAITIAVVVALALAFFLSEIRLRAARIARRQGWHRLAVVFRIPMSPDPKMEARIAASIFQRLQIQLRSREDEDEVVASESVEEIVRRLELVVVPPRNPLEEQEEIAGLLEAERERYLSAGEKFLMQKAAEAALRNADAERWNQQAAQIQQLYEQNAIQADSNAIRQDAEATRNALLMAHCEHQAAFIAELLAIEVDELEEDLGRPPAGSQFEPESSASDAAGSAPKLSVLG